MYPNSDSDEEGKGYPHDPEYFTDRKSLQIARKKELKNDAKDPKQRRHRDIRDQRIPPNPYDPNEMELSNRGREWEEKRAQYDARRARNNRLAGIKKGWILPNPNNPAEVELSRTREAKLDANPRKVDQRRPLDQRWQQRQQPKWYDFFKCQVCEKIDTPLFHCAECMDSAYCSQRCQIQGCGYKH
jgi:hypothetical protein